MPPRQRELPVRSLPKSTAPNPRRRKVWPWAVGVGLLAAVGIAGGLVYTGKLTLPLVAQRLVQDYLPVHAPRLRVGDGSAYEVLAELGEFYSHKTINETMSIQVTAIKGDQISFNISGRGGGEQLVYDRELNEILFKGDDAIDSVVSHGVDSLFPFVYAHDFPLRPGKKWHKSSARILIATKPKNGREEEERAIEHLTVTGSALGWERAIGRLDGEMVDGLKLRIETRSDLSIGSQSVRITRASTEWYVPAAQRSVLIRNQSDFLSKNGKSRSVATMRLVNFIPNNSSDKE